MDSKKKQTEIHTWLDHFLRWVRALLGVREPRTSTVKSRRYSNNHSSALFTLQRDTPGAVETWRVVHGAATGAILITLDNLPDCRAYYKQQRRDARRAGQQYTTTANERNLRLADGEIHTHRFSVSWLAYTPKGQKVRLIGVWDGDFAGFSKQYAMGLKQRVVASNDENLKRQMGNRAAVKIGEAIALELLELKSLPGFSWEERIGAYQWQELLEAYTRHVHRAADFDPKIICRSR